MRDNTLGIYKYGSCNINSLINALNIISANYKVSENLDELLSYKKIIFPGVGNMKNLHENEIKNISKKINKYVKNGGFVFGICLGLQLLFEFSEESNSNTVGLLKGKCISIKKDFDLNLNVKYEKLEFTKDILKKLLYRIDPKLKKRK